MPTTMDSFCRLCRRSGEFESASILDTSRNHSGEIIAEIMQNCLQLQVLPSDGLPQRICNLCQAQLEMFYLLRKVSFNSECYFKQLLEHNHPQQHTMLSTNDNGVHLTPDVGGFPIALDQPQQTEVKIEPTEFNTHEPQSHQQSYENSFQCMEQPEVKIEPNELNDEPQHYQPSYDKSYDPHTNHESATPSNSSEWIPVDPRPVDKPKLPKRYSCAECGYHSQYKANLFRHIKLRRHSLVQQGFKTRPRRRLTLDEILANSNAPEMKIYTCKMCGYKTAFKGNVDRHQRSQNHQGIDVSIYGKNQPRMDCLMSQRMKYVPDGRYQPVISTSAQAMTAYTEPASQQHCMNQAEQELLREIRDEFMKINATNSGINMFNQDPC
ncbi:uncharacterized protein LOC131685158 [Topomyia yanbarensis]|uniref:uncharacterized protein LOC131685158 n=1 Tax=Topomyia yanbarensis TaxID=2498891 RepID=UPI00273ACA4B|nr:uncharacterized protein LOC131685158 [Topomyia yanbarensis]